jgi:hypothetical protein
MPEQARSAGRPNEEQSDEWLDRLVSFFIWQGPSQTVLLKCCSKASKITNPVLGSEVGNSQPRRPNTHDGSDSDFSPQQTVLIQVLGRLNFREP